MLRSLLRLALSESVVVEKTRLVNLIAQTWAHLDALRGIGGFLELEVVLQEGRSPTEAHAIASDLMQRLVIKETDLISAAYANILIERAVVASATPDPSPARSSVPQPRASRQNVRPERSRPCETHCVQSGPVTRLSLRRNHATLHGIRTGTACGGVSKP
jgi:hypothetical protein